MNIVDVYLRYGVHHRVDAARGGWVSTTCPYCVGSEDDYLGFSVEKSYFRCWSCGWHPIVETLERVCHVDRGVALELYHSISEGPRTSLRGLRDRVVQAKVGISLYRRPGDVGPMRPNHRRYLEGRGFDPDEVEREWGVLGTGPASRLDGIDYRFRLLVPVRWSGAEVSFQARDVTEKSDLKYISCPTRREVEHHKHVLYGRQERWGRTGIIVEGVTDVWRLGPSACAVFGVQYTAEQVLVITRSFERVAIVFDAERQAQRQARKLAAQLRQIMSSEPIVVDLGGGVDPGSMGQDDADHLVRELVG
jgi:hypothetical protein